MFEKEVKWVQDKVRRYQQELAIILIILLLMLGTSVVSLPPLNTGAGEMVDYVNIDKKVDKLMHNSTWLKEQGYPKLVFNSTYKEQKETLRFMVEGHVWNTRVNDWLAKKYPNATEKEWGNARVKFLANSTLVNEVVKNGKKDFSLTAVEAMR